MSQKSILFSTYIKAPADGYNTTSNSVTPLRFRVPHGFEIGSYACLLENFDMAFRSRRESVLGGEHSIHAFNLVPRPSITDGHLTLDVEFVLNKESDTDNNEKNDTYISPESYARVLTIVTPVGSASDIQAFQTDCTASVPPAGTTAVTFSSSGVFLNAPVSTALTGWEAIVSTSDGDSQDDQQIACFDMTAGQAAATTASSSAQSATVSGAYVALNDHDTDSGKKPKKSDPFDSTGYFAALTTASDDFAIQEFDAGSGVVSHDFGAPVAQAYAVIRNLRNFGENSASSEDDTSFNELASFTCLGPKLTISGSVVSFNWDTVLAHWGDKFSGSDVSLNELVAFKSKVDLTVIAQFE